MGNEIGINFKVDAQTDGLKRAAGDFSAFQEKLSSVLGITDPEKAEQYWQEFNAGLTKAVALTDQMSLIEQRKVKGSAPPPGGAGVPGREMVPAGGREVAERGDGSMITTLSRSIYAFMKSTPSYIAGASRDVAGAGLSAGGSLIDSAMGTLSGLPTAALVGGGIAAGVVAVGAIGNALSKQYEAVIPQLMETTAALKMFGDTAEEQSGLFRSNMKSITDVSTKYGYTLQQGMATVTQAARGGAGAGKTGDAYGADVKTVAEKVMQASVAVGLATPSSQFLELATLGSRFGQNNALGVSLGNANNTVGSPRAQETASALATMFEDVMNQGVSANFKELGATQTWMSRVFGERAAGSGGAQMFGGLSSAVRASTSLSNETDILKYRAAMNLPGVSNPMGGLMKLEEGFSPDLFNEFQKIISGASDWDKTFLTSKAFAVNLTTASRMNKSPGLAKEYYEDSIAGKGDKMKETHENELKTYQEKVLQALREAGTGAFDIKTEIIKGTSNIVEAIIHPEKTINATPVLPSTPAASAAATTSVESGKIFASLLKGGSGIAGYGGDVLDSRDYIASRYVAKELDKGLATLYYVTNALHDDAFIANQSPDTITAWGMLNSKEPGTDWSSMELESLKAAISSLYGTGKQPTPAKPLSGTTTPPQSPPASPPVDISSVFGVFEPAKRATIVGADSSSGGNLAKELDGLIAKTRDKFSKLSPTEREEALSVAMSDKAPGANTEEQREMIRILKLIAAYTKDMGTFDVVLGEGFRPKK